MEDSIFYLSRTAKRKQSRFIPRITSLELPLAMVEAWMRDTQLSDFFVHFNSPCKLIGCGDKLFLIGISYPSGQCDLKSGLRRTQPSVGLVRGW